MTHRHDWKMSVEFYPHEICVTCGMRRYTDPHSGDRRVSRAWTEPDLRTALRFCRRYAGYNRCTPRSWRRKVEILARLLDVRDDVGVLLAPDLRYAYRGPMRLRRVNGYPGVPWSYPAPGSLP